MFVTYIFPAPVASEEDQIATGEREEKKEEEEEEKDCGQVVEQEDVHVSQELDMSQIVPLPPARNGGKRPVAAFFKAKDPKKAKR